MRLELPQKPFQKQNATEEAFLSLCVRRRTVHPEEDMTAKRGNEMAQNQKKEKKKIICFNKQWVMPVVVFVVGIIALYYGVTDMREVSREQEEAISQLNAVSYGERIIDDLREGAEITKALDALHNFGYEYRVLKTESPLDTQYQEVYNSGKELQNPVSYSFEADGCAWKLQVMPSKGWGQKGKNAAIIVGILGTIIVCLLTVLTAASLALQKERNTFRELSVTDSLTGLLNRNGFDLQAELYMKAHPNEPCVGIILDVDDFKFINDVYGHGCGDETLRKVSETIKERFDCDAILARYGGDEFGMLLKNCTAEEMAERIKDFAEKPGSFRYHGRTHKFTISLGYAEHPADAKTAAELLTAADMALYEVKLHSKHGCMAYDSNFQIRSRERLGFALHDISKNLPGAFLIYAAEPDDDRILFANHELIQLAGCQDIDDLMEFSHGHFRNLLHPEEQDTIEENIWKQIDNCGEEGNAYVRFRLARKDGSFRRVLNHSRIVDSIHYGRVFYAILMDCDMLQSSCA